MARPRLRKLDPTMDLSRHLIALEALPRPWDPRAVFGREALLEVEIGSGKGLFLRNAAATHPETDYLGVELAPAYARHAAAGLAKLALPNAVVALGDARRLFEDILPEGAAAAVHVYFPDPWWKKRHQKRRLMQEGFVERIERALRPGGVLHYWTDVEEQFHTVVDLMAARTRLEGPIAVPETPAAGDLDYRTHFERRARLHGQTVYRAQWRKR